MYNKAKWNKWDYRKTAEDIKRTRASNPHEPSLAQKPGRESKEEWEKS